MVIPQWAALPDAAISGDLWGASLLPRDWGGLELVFPCWCILMPWKREGNGAPGGGLYTLLASPGAIEIWYPHFWPNYRKFKITIPTKKVPTDHRFVSMGTYQAEAGLYSGEDSRSHTPRRVTLTKNQATASRLRGINQRLTETTQTENLVAKQRGW